MSAHPINSTRPTFMSKKIWTDIVGHMVQLFVKGLKGETYTCDIDESDNIREIRKQFSEKANIPIHEVRLVFSGKQLEDGRTLKYYNISHHSVVQTVLRIRGGLRDQSDIVVHDTSIIPDFT